MKELIVIRKYDPTPEGFKRIDVTSHNQLLNKYLSPFYLGPIISFDNIECKIMENLWQFGKVYEEHVNENNEVNDLWKKWRLNGFLDNKPHRHPYKGKPLFHYWNGEKLKYIESRKKVYIPAYINCVNNNKGVEYIKEELKNNNIALADFDGFNFVKAGMTIEELIEDDKHIMGHGHVLYLLIKKPDIAYEYLKNSIWY